MKRARPQALAYTVADAFFTLFLLPLIGAVMGTAAFIALFIAGSCML